MTTEAGGVLVMMQRAGDRVKALPPRRRNALMMMALLVVAAGATLTWWEGRTDWKPVYSGLEGRDLQQVEQELGAAGIEYQLTEDGSGVRVPADLVTKARTEVAAKGMPQTGRMGFELFDKPNWVGSEFDEKVNYQRALEGELEQTIATLSAVRSARVHLALAKDSLFAGEREPAKASVVLKLRNGTMPPQQAETVRNLVAGAVENLSADKVTLVDADGRARLSAPGEAEAAGDAERGLEAKVIALLEPLAGRDNVRATVSVAYDTTAEEKTDDVVDPAQTAALTMQKREESTTGAQHASGVPGTASNTAAAVPQASVAAEAKASLPVYPTASSAPGQMAHEENGTYAVTRHTTHTEIAAGRVARITAAVVVNDREVHDADGKAEHVAWKPRTPEEMKRMEELTQAAVGFDSKRGDSVIVQNVSFSANVSPVAEPAMTKATDEARQFLRTQPGLLRTAVGGALALLLLFVIVKPAARKAMDVLSEPYALPAGESVSRAAWLPAPQDERAMGMAQGSSPMGALSAQGWNDNEMSMKPQLRSSGKKPRSVAAIDDEGVLEYVSEHLRREPMQGQRLLEAWIGAKEGAA